jgi:hypothetical protein
MDPYLEHPEFFPDVHDTFIVYLREFLQPRLPEPYYATTRARVWVEYTDRSITPDLNLSRTDQPSKGPATQGELRGAVAVGVRPITVPADEMREAFLEIRTVRGKRQLVTAVELLSLSNKTPGDSGRGQYLEKQTELHGSQVNIVEIDLLRGGRHTTLAKREDVVAAVGPFDYHVCIRKMDDLERSHVYPIRLDQKLPEITIPLLPGDGGVAVNLQAVFDRCYDSGPYHRAEPYRQPPEPPLTTEQTAWAEKLLRDKGLLPPA